MAADLIKLSHGANLLLMGIMVVIAYHLLIFAQRTLPVSLLGDHLGQVQLRDIMLVVSDPIRGHFYVAGEVLRCFFRRVHQQLFVLLPFHFFSVPLLLLERNFSVNRMHNLSMKL